MRQVANIAGKSAMTNKKKPRIKQSIASLESQIAEWKETWRDDYLKWPCAFAITDGGTLEIGKNDKGAAVPLDDVKEPLEQLPNKIRQGRGIVADVRLVSAKAICWCRALSNTITDGRQPRHGETSRGMEARRFPTPLEARAPDCSRETGCTRGSITESKISMVTALV